jgi:heat shock protein HslJ
VPPTAVPPTAVTPTAVPQPSPIVGVNWLLTAYNNGQGALVSPIAGTAITALFDSDGVVSGTDSCNSYQAPYTVNGANLQIGLATGTSMACDETITEQANGYLAALPQVATYQVSGNQLTLNSSSGQRLLQYVSQ